MDDMKLAGWTGLKTRFEELANKSEELLRRKHADFTFRPSDSEINRIVNDYNDARSCLSMFGLGFLTNVVRYIDYPSTSKPDVGLLQQAITNSRAAAKAIEELIPRKIPPELVNQLEGWKREVMSIESLDYDVYKNLDEAIKEMEHGHYIASGLISARVVAWIIQQIPPEGQDIENKDRKKVRTLIEAGVINKDDRDLHAIIFRAARLARNFVSHRIDRYPAPEDASSLLSDAIKLVKIYTEFSKLKEDEDK